MRTNYLLLKSLPWVALQIANRIFTTVWQNCTYCKKKKKKATVITVILRNNSLHLQKQAYDIKWWKPQRSKNGPCPVPLCWRTVNIPLFEFLFFSKAYSKTHSVAWSSLLIKLKYRFQLKNKVHNIMQYLWDIYSMYSFAS